MIRIYTAIIDLPREKVDPILSRRYHLPFNIKTNDKSDSGLFDFMEQCVNGMLTSTKFESGNPPMNGCLKVIVFSNSMPDIMVTSADRWRLSIIKNQENLLCEDYKFVTKRRDLNTKEIIQEYLKIPDFKEYLFERENDVTKIEAALIYDPDKIDHRID